jgi:hypothetical protein
MGEKMTEEIIDRNKHKSKIEQDNKNLKKVN